MLIQFTFGNFRSFKGEATLSLVAASKLQADPALDAGNVFQARERPRLDLLRVAALYGANASGKSNIALAMGWFRKCVIESANLGFRFDPQPFLFDTTSREKPISFEITFLHNQVQYRYGYEIKQGQRFIEIVSEWLYSAKTTTEAMLFEREGNIVRQGRQFTEGKPLLTDGKVNRADALFLSLNAQLGTKTASALVTYLITNLNFIMGIDDAPMHEITLRCLKQDRYLDTILSLMQAADHGISRIGYFDKDGQNANQRSPLWTREKVEKIVRQGKKEEAGVITGHPVFDAAGKEDGDVLLPLDTLSQGTKKQFAFSGPILEVLAHGGTLIIDEMDARFHPLLTRALVRLFQSPETNPKNAQLIFITHDTNLLDSKSLRRDQIWFVEKDRFGGSHLYSLSDFKGVRKDASFEEEYIQGRYGAIPFLGGLNKLFQSEEEIPENTPAGDVHATA